MGRKLKFGTKPVKIGIIVPNDTLAKLDQLGKLMRMDRSETIVLLVNEKEISIDSIVKPKKILDPVKRRGITPSKVKPRLPTKQDAERHDAEHIHYTPNPDVISRWEAVFNERMARFKEYAGMPNNYYLMLDQIALLQDPLSKAQNSFDLYYTSGKIEKLWLACENILADHGIFPTSDQIDYNQSEKQTITSPDTPPLWPWEAPHDKDCQCPKCKEARKNAELPTV